MPNMYDYLESHGNLSFAQASFNEVDNLIFAWLSYVDFDGILKKGVSMSIRSARDVFFKTHERIGDKPNFKTYINPLLMSTQLLDKLAETARFRDLILTNYKSRLNPKKNEQFAVVTILIDEQLAYVAYRGTDHTLVGWKEDCYMSFMRVPSQTDALRYLNALDVGTRRLIIGGHSKGGNLAEYAALQCHADTWNRIEQVYSNDGPGFREEMLSSIGDRGVMGKLRSIIPRASVVGMLFRHIEPHKIVEATQYGLMQHNAMDWQVQGSEFAQVPGLSWSSMFLDKTVKDWMDSLNQTQLKGFVDALFDTLGSMGSTSFDELDTGEILRALGGMEGERGRAMAHVLEKLFAAGFRVTGTVMSEVFHHNQGLG